MMSDDIPSNTSTTPQTLDTPVTIPRERRRSKRNYWAHTAPEEYVQYPNFEPISYLAEARLIQRAQAGDLEARNQIWARNARLVLSVVNEFKIPRDMMADAIQEGVLGLLRAIEKYDVNRLNAFSTYAWYWVWRHIQIFLSRQRSFVRIPAHLLPEIYRHIQSGASIDRGNGDERIDRLARVIRPLQLHLVREHDHPEVRVSAQSQDFLELREDIRKKLHNREYDILCHRFGLIDGEPRTLKELGILFDLTRERIRQIETRALFRLRMFLPVSYHQFFPNFIPIGSTPSPSLPDVSGSDKRQHPKRTLRRARSVNSQEMENILLTIFKDFSFLEANSLIYHYGLMHAPQLPMREIGEMLEVSPPRVWWLIRRGRKKLLAETAMYPFVEVIELRRHIKADPIARQAAPPKRFD